MEKNTIVERSISYFTAKKYNLQTRSEDVVVFQSDEREVNWILFGLLCCCGFLLIGLLYYFAFCQRHQVILSFSGAQVTATGNTDQAKRDAVEFTQIISNPGTGIPSIPAEGPVCSQCGTPLVLGKKFCPNCGNKVE